MNYYKATEKFLYNYISLKISIENMKQEIEEIEYNDLSAVNYDKEPTSKTYKFNSQTENEAIRVADIKETIKHRIKTLESKLERIDRAINSLNEIEQKIIRMWYMQGKQWWQIISEIRYSERQCRRIKHRAVTKIAVALFGEEAMNMSDSCPPKAINM